MESRKVVGSPARRTSLREGRLRVNASAPFADPIFPRGRVKGKEARFFATTSFFRASRSVQAGGSSPSGEMKALWPEDFACLTADDESPSIMLRAAEPFQRVIAVRQERQATENP